jgi:hypothetical protein
MADNNYDLKIPKKMCNPPVWLSLPSAWDWSISNAENLRKMAYNINVIIQYLQDLQTNYEAYTDKKVAELKDYVDAADKALHDYADSLNAAMKSYVDAQDLAYWERHTKDITRLQNNIDALRAYCDENFNDIRTKHAQDIAQLKGALEAQYEQLMAYTDRQIDIVQAWVNEELDKIRLEVDEINEDGFRINNPTTGERDHVGNTVSDVYNALRVHAITCDEFDSWFDFYGNTCDDFRNLFMSALEFDTYSREIMFAEYRAEVNSPVTGEMVSHAVALEQVKTFNAEQTLDCTDRDGLDLTCEQILAKNWSAFKWDTESVGYFNTDTFLIFKTNNFFVVINNYTFDRSAFPEESTTGTNTVYPSVSGWHFDIVKLEPIYDATDNASINMSTVIYNRKNIQNGVKVTQFSITYNKTEENNARMSGCTCTIIDIYNSFSEAKGGKIA